MTTSTATRCLCDKLPTGTICVFCAYERGFPAKLYVNNRAYDDSSSRCVECGCRVHTEYDRCYDCRVQRVRR